MEFAIRRREKYSFIFLHLICKLTVGTLVTDMLLSLLNICTKEELEEVDEGLVDVRETAEEYAERKRVIKSKILAVGRVSRVFALLRYAFCWTFNLQLLLTINIQRGVRACF